MVKNLSCSAGDMVLIAGGGTKIPYAAEKLSLRAITGESVHQNERSHMAQFKSHRAK